jgi:ribosomal protein S9
MAMFLRVTFDIRSVTLVHGFGVGIKVECGGRVTQAHAVKQGPAEVTMRLVTVG